MKRAAFIVLGGAALVATLASPALAEPPTRASASPSFDVRAERVEPAAFSAHTAALFSLTPLPVDLGNFCAHNQSKSRSHPPLTA